MQDVGYYFCCHRRRRWDDWSHTIPQRTNCLFTAKRIALAIEVYWSKTKRSRSPLSHLPVFNHSMPFSRTFIVNPASDQRRADVRDCWFGIGGDHSLPAWYFLPESVIFRCTRPRVTPIPLWKGRRQYSCLFFKLAVTAVCLGRESLFTSQLKHPCAHVV